MIAQILNSFLLIEQKIPPIEQVWPGCRMVNNELLKGNMSGYLSIVDNLTNIGIVSGIIIFFVVAFGRIIIGAKEVFMATFNSKNLFKMEREINMRTNRNTLLLFSVFLLSFVFANYSQSLTLFGMSGVWLRFLIILAIIPAYMALKYLFFVSMAWVNNNPVFKVLMGINSTYLTFILFSTIIGCLIYKVVPTIDINYLLIYVLCCAVVGGFLFFIRGYRLIITNGFSQFFWILYLCTLELLPIVFAANIFL